MTYLRSKRFYALIAISAALFLLSVSAAHATGVTLWTQQFDSTTANGTSYGPYNGYLAIMGNCGGACPGGYFSDTAFDNTQFTNNFVDDSPWTVVSGSYQSTATTTTTTDVLNTVAGGAGSMRNLFVLEFGS